MRQYIFIIFFSIFLLFSMLLGIFCFVTDNHTIDFSSLQQDVSAKPSVLLDVNGVKWGRFQQDKRKYVALESLPQHLVQAFLVTEDRSFFAHPGISFRGIVRSFLVNLIKGRRAQGASTITQQLVRLKFLTTKKTFSRKIKEQLYAILVEREWSKEQILEAYLNHVYFGYGIYGVQAAANRFWGIDVSQVSIDQAAVLAGVMKSPRIYCPINAPSNALQRRNFILSTMQENKMIGKQECNEAQGRALGIINQDRGCIAPHVKEMIRAMMEKMVGKERLYTGGLTIQTTIDVSIQEQASQAFASHVASLKKKLHEDVDGGLISIDSQSGGIRALVGGYKFDDSKFNRAVQAHRQMGSVFKIFVYGAALEHGYSFSDVLQDEPFELAQHDGSVWRPKNRNDLFVGPMTRAYSLSHSNNIVAIKTLLEVGVENVIDLARRCHLFSVMPPYPSLALGCTDVTVMEAVGAFNVIANHGNFVQPHIVSWVKDQYGKKTYKNSSQPVRAMSSAVASQVNRVLTFSIKRLQASFQDSDFGCEAMGKTGTTNDSRTCWFCGSTPELTTAIYIGRDSNESMGKKVYGSKTAFPIWLKMHKKIAKTKTNFYYDPQLKDVFVNWINGKMNQDPSKPDVVSLLA